MVYLKEIKIKQFITNYLLIAACITAAMGIMGMLLLPDLKVGYDNFFVPFLFAAISMFPSIAYYSRRILTRSQMRLRMILHGVLLEMVILLFAYFAGILTDGKVTIALAVSVLVIDIMMILLTRVNTSRVAAEFNVALKQMQEKEIEKGLE